MPRTIPEVVGASTVIGERCQATNRAGKPCSATPRPGRPLCPWHDPELATARLAWSARGGQGRSNQARAKRHLPDALELDDLRGMLSVVLTSVVTGKLEPGVGNSAAALARAMVVVDEAAKSSDFDQRLAELERAAGAGRR